MCGECDRDCHQTLGSILTKCCTLVLGHKISDRLWRMLSHLYVANLLKPYYSKVYKITNLTKIFKKRIFSARMVVQTEVQDVTFEILPFWLFCGVWVEGWSFGGGWGGGDVWNVVHTFYIFSYSHFEGFFLCCCSNTTFLNNLLTHPINKNLNQFDWNAKNSWS